CFIKSALGRGGSTVWHLVRGTTAAVPCRVDLGRNPVINLPRGENERRCTIALPNAVAGYWQVYLLHQHLPTVTKGIDILAQEKGSAENDESHPASTQGQRRQVAVVRLARRVPYDLLVRGGRRDVPSLWGVCRRAARGE